MDTFATFCLKNCVLDFVFGDCLAYRLEKVITSSLKKNLLMPQTIINLPEIRSFFMGYCQDMEIPFSDELFNNYLLHLEIDFYDWLKDNAKSFGK